MPRNGSARSTQQQAAIAGVIARAARPLTAQEILDLAQNDVPSLGIATVYRHIKRLVEAEEVVSVELPGEPARYESAHHDHHHHFHCRTCDRVFDIPGCQAHIDSSVPEGFVVERHEVVLYGICGACDP